MSIGQSGHPGDDVLCPTRITKFGQGGIDIERIICIEHNTFFITKPDPYRRIYGKFDHILINTLQLVGFQRRDSWVFP